MSALIVVTRRKEAEVRREKCRCAHEKLLWEHLKGNDDQLISVFVLLAEASENGTARRQTKEIESQPTHPKKEGKRTETKTQRFRFKDENENANENETNTQKTCVLLVFQ